MVYGDVVYGSVIVYGGRVEWVGGVNGGNVIWDRFSKL